MGTVSTFGTFTMAKLGIYASQKALNVTGNNIANINTTGYTRQEIDQRALQMGGADRYTSKMDMRIGGGTLVTNVNQIRDQYLDIRYRNQQSNVGATDERLSVLEQLSAYLDEVGSGEDDEGMLEARYNEMVTQVEKLVAQGAGKDEYDTLFRSAANAFLTQLKKTAADLDGLQADQEESFRQDLESVNNLIESIRDMNVDIRKSNVYGSQSLLQQDERNNLIDELSKYMHINVTYGEEDLGDDFKIPKLTITTADEPQRTLVDGVYCAQFSIRQVDSGETDDEGNPIMADDPNFNLDLAELTGPRGQSMVTREETVEGVMGDTGERYASASRDITGSYTGDFKLAEDGNIYQARSLRNSGEPDYTPMTGAALVAYGNESDAQAKAQELNDALTDEEKETTEWRVVPYEDEEGYFEVHKFSTSFDSEDAATAAAANLPTEGIDEETGEKYTIEYEPVEKDDKYQLNEARSYTGAAELSDTELYGSLQSSREMLTKSGVFSNAGDLAADPNASGKHGIPFYRQALDVLANQFAAVMNTANQLSDPDKTIYEYDTDGKIKVGDDGTYVLTDPTKTLWSDPDKTVYEYDQDGNIKTIEATIPNEDGTTGTETLYVLRDPKQTIYEYDDDGNVKTDAAGAYVLKDAKHYGRYPGGPLFSSDGNSNNPDGIDASNICISKEWSNGSLRVMTDDRQAELSTSNNNLVHILNLLTGDQQFYTSPADSGAGDLKTDSADSEPFFTGTFAELFTNHMGSTLANDRHVTAVMLNDYNTTADDLYVDRESVSGVDLNDEAINMMMYQKSYSAACRLMTVYDQLLDKLINGTAV